ncbi:hypothetical protein GCM10011346_11120 [Oceanobacillus neutriphilus]|uniref:Uncharacterized protein n=1 Tax=Oceanobacillus neutriphilus TaxID=531815 RepID=A0ABQ2NSL0_9BACI|nr:hypothetical protein GCM10011346_11120 [Oceanobacillus neutriphilus]
MRDSEEKYSVFEAALQTVVYLKSKRYTASWFVLTFVLTADTYVISKHNFTLKSLCFLKNKECKKNERI